MIKAGLWKYKQKRPRYRKLRTRMSCFGIMIQLDGSHHDWFEERGPKCTLILLIDDSTSAIVHMEFFKSESIESVMKASRKYIEKYGKPGSFYVDHGCVYSVNLSNPDGDKKTQFERALEELRINIIHANSPQAKGRVERAFETLQDRLVKELRLANISTIEAANDFLEGYIKEHNEKYAIDPANSENMHIPIVDIDLDTIFCLKEVRILRNDFVLLYKNKILQLNKQQRAVVRPKDFITIREQFDGTISISLREVKLSFNFVEQLPAKPQKVYNNEVPRKVSLNSRIWNSGKLASNHGEIEVRHGVSARVE